MKKQQAKKVLEAVLLQDYDQLRALGVRVYGNQGRACSGTACITNLDDSKGQCNPRLAFNSCDVQDIGCPECLKALVALATGGKIVARA
jgi:hypothetical protein|tara:strand:- start:234 stop:500 length:267 start_codon:yes stop_codon:yes gene_type:complete